MLILDEADRARAAIDNINRGRDGENGRADPMPIEQLYLFAGWTLEETARNLVSPAGRRVDLTSSEFNLLLAFVRQPGQALSRDALLGVAQRPGMDVFRSFDRHARGATAQEAGLWRRPAAARSLRARRRLYFLRRCRQDLPGRTIRRRLSRRLTGGEFGCYR